MLSPLTPFGKGPRQMSEIEQLKPRIIVELLPDGSYAIERYSNGMRSRETFEYGALQHAVADALADQAKAIANAAERQALAKAKAEAELHRKVWSRSAATPGQGVGFANKYIGSMDDYNPSAKPNPNFAPKMVPMASLLD